MRCAAPAPIAIADLPSALANGDGPPLVAQLHDALTGAAVEDAAATVAAADYVFEYRDTQIEAFTISLTLAEENESEFRVTVGFLNADAARTGPKSGDVGYALGEPVIAAIEHDGSFLVPNATAGSFPIPFGYDCESVEYTPLLFGVDTIGGCTDGDPEEAVDLTAYSHFAINGRASPANSGDWIPVSGQNCTGVIPNFQRFIFYYEKFGSVTNAQYRLNSVFHLCDRNDTVQGYIVTASFLLIADQPLTRYVPPNPKTIGVPRDTWYPFSSSAGSPVFSAPSAYLMAACIVLAVFFA
jgi:hypothetical protein